MFYSTLKWWKTRTNCLYTLALEAQMNSAKSSVNPKLFTKLIFDSNCILILIIFINNKQSKENVQHTCVSSLYLFSCGYIVRTHDSIHPKLKGNNDAATTCTFVMLKKKPLGLQVSKINQLPIFSHTFCNFFLYYYIDSKNIE